MNPGGMEPDPMNPDPGGMPVGEDTDDGGCSTSGGHGAGTLLFAAIAGLLARRRRR
jgi:MYXO-CTERM domain-containing protein